MPSAFKINDVKSKKMQRTLNLFDVNGDGIISKDEAAKISLFYKTGSATFSKNENGKITSYTISAKKSGKNPIETKTEVVDAQSDNLLYSEYTSFNLRVKEQRTDQLIQQEESHISNNDAHQRISTFNFSTNRNGEVNVTKTNHGDGSTEQYKYQTE